MQNIASKRVLGVTDMETQIHNINQMIITIISSWVKAK